MMFVSHNLEEVLGIADHVTVFRDGEVTASRPRDVSVRSRARAPVTASSWNIP